VPALPGISREKIMPDKEAFGPDMKWSEEARAKRSEAAKKAAATRKAKKAQLDANLMSHAHIPLKGRTYPYYQGSRTARLAVCSVSKIAFIRAAQYIRWHAPTYLTASPVPQF